MLRIDVIGAFRYLIKTAHTSIVGTSSERPGGIFIDGNDILYACDVGADDARTDGFLRGIRIGSVTDGRVVAFIPDPGLTHTAIRPKVWQ
ncbi:MAG: hypothetical protein Ct9H300mP25_12000 [Acidobacteriota bacterium]|nr:MAG: hypothetical protein Ct9H300mP25_12000 [Acidobacteriota bacterium]